MSNTHFSHPAGGSPSFELLAPVDPRYATLPVAQAFNWGECLAREDEGRWYMVVFRSERRPDADNEKLLAYDERAYQEAKAKAGLVRYFRGNMDQDRNCLSLCIWDRRHQAKRANTLPEHRTASALTHEMYVWYRVERYALLKRTGFLEPEIRPLGPVSGGMPPDTSAPGSLEPDSPVEATRAPSA